MHHVLKDIVADARKPILTKSQNVWHPVRVTEKKQQQQRDQPEVRPGNETGYRQTVGGNLHVVVFFVNGHWSNPARARVLLPRKSSTIGCQSGVTAALDAQDHGMVICAFPKSIWRPGMILLPFLLLQCAKKPESSGSRDGWTSMTSGTDPLRRASRGWGVGRGDGTWAGGEVLERRSSYRQAEETAAIHNPPMRRARLPALPLYCTAAQALTSQG